MSEGVQKLAFLAGGLVLLVAVHILPLLILNQPQLFIVMGIGFYVGNLVLFIWLLSLGQGKMDFTFFDKALLGYYGLWFVGLFVMIGFDDVLAWIGGDLVVASLFSMMPLFGMLWLLLAWLVGRDRFEEPSYHAVYIPPAPQKPERPNVHIEVERRRYTIKRD